MIKKNIGMACFTAVFAAAFASLAFAGSWRRDDTGTWYENRDGSYPVSAWKWIDRDGDGREECYYFDKNGYLVILGRTEDGYDTDSSGAWTEDGNVKTRSARGFAAELMERAVCGGNGISISDPEGRLSSLYYSYEVINTGSVTDKTIVFSDRKTDGMALTLSAAAASKLGTAATDEIRRALQEKYESMSGDRVLTEDVDETGHAVIAVSGDIEDADGTCRVIVCMSADDENIYTVQYACYGSLPEDVNAVWLSRCVSVTGYDGVRSPKEGSVSEAQRIVLKKQFNY